MAPLICPLCCNQTFSSHMSLKYHILGMLDCLLCPSCNERCEDLMDFADHLGRECKNLKKSSGLDEATEVKSVVNLEEPITENPDLMRVKEEVQDVASVASPDNTNSEIEKETDHNVTEIDQSEIQDDPNMIYTCEMCDMTFSSVQEHLAKYHEGEEVLLETEESQDETAEVQESEVFLYDDEMIDDDGSTVGESMDNTSERFEGEIAGKESTLEQNLQVGANWTEENQNPGVDFTPITTKYIVENGKVCKITDEEADDISDKSRIIEVHRCPNCNLQFPNMSHFKKHNCSNIKKVVSKRAENAEKKHQLNKIKEEFRYQCTFCLTIYTSLIALNDHMKSHLIQDETGMVQKKTITMTLHNCDVCNTKFPTYKQLRLHSRMHEPIKAKQVDPPVPYNITGQPNGDISDSANTEREKFECPVCGKMYDKEYEEIHMKYHEDGEQFICLVCNRKFDSKDNLDLHAKAHSSTKKLYCSYCKKSFNNYLALEEHSEKQCQKRDFACQYCGRRFSRPHEKVKHERIHTGEKPHVCEVCGKSFRVGYCLTLHLRTHTGNRPYTCHQCGKRFKSYSVFNHHMKTHSDERNYKCPFCPKAFKTAVQLAGHKNSHTKPFSCTECNRPFASLYAVRAHMETHKRDNNLKFECWLCGASYARSFALKDHITEVHGQGASEGQSQDEQALIKLEALTNESKTENTESHPGDPIEENQEQMATENGEYQEIGTDAEMCQVQVMSEAGEGEGYVVHLQEVESSVPIKESHMEVVEA